MTRPILGITMGDPAGVGPEIIARAAAEAEVARTSRPVVIGDASVMREALRLVDSPLALRPITDIAACRWSEGTLECLDLANVEVATLPRGEVSAAAGRAAHAYILRAVDLATSRAIDGIVTAPINKEALAAAGMPHTGHTEILAELSNTRDYAMLLMGKDLRVIHVTTHVSLRRVPDLVTRERVLRTIRLAQQTMDRPRPAAAAHRRVRPQPARRRGGPLRRRGEDGHRARHRGRAGRGPRRSTGRCPPTPCSPAPAAGSLISSSPCITTRDTSR